MSGLLFRGQKQIGQLQDLTSNNSSTHIAK